MPDVEPTREHPEHDPLVGTTVDGRYTIERALAAGGMGSVYLARQKNLSRPVAIKVVTNADEELVERFRREAESLAEVSHPAIVEVHDFIRAEEGQGRCYLVMSYVEGEDLEDYLDRVPGGAIPPAEAVALVTPVVSALVQLHANGIVHRDIKPANIIRFQGADGRPAVKLVDFGIARRSVDTSLTSVGYIIGTPPYMAPETLMAKPHTPLADVYAIGATLYELVVGAPPHGRGALHEIMARALKDRPFLPPHLASSSLGLLIGQLLEQDERRRPDALQALEALEHIRDELAAERLAAGGVALTGPRPAPVQGSADRQAATVQITPPRPQPSVVAPPGPPPAGRPPPSTMATAALAASGTAPAPGSPSFHGQAVTDPRLFSGTAPVAHAATGPHAGGAPRGTLSTLPPTPAPGAERRRSAWIWLGPLLAVPVIIAIVTITLVLGRNDGPKKAREGDGARAEAMEARDGDAMAREASAGGAMAAEPAGRREPAREPGASRRVPGEAQVRGAVVAPRRPGGADEDWGPERVKALVETCQTHKDSVRLFDLAKDADRGKLSKEPGAWKKAVAHYQAVLQCGHSSVVQRMWSARLIANIFLRLRDCTAMRRMWRTYQQLSWAAGKRPKLMPRCR